MLYTEKGEAVCHKIDIFQNLMWYYYKNDDSHTLYAIPTDKIKEIIQSNKENKKVEDLERYAKINQSKFNEVEVNIDDLKRIND